MRFTEPYRIAVALQRLLVETAFLPETKPLEKSSLVRSWCELEETKRCLKMRPLPKPIDVSIPMKSIRAKADTIFLENGPEPGTSQAPNPKP